jgi:hypothetical protein
MLFIDITVVMKTMDCLEIMDCVVAMEIIFITAIIARPPY